MSEEANVSVEDENLEAVAEASESTEHNDVSREAHEAEQRKRNDAEYNWAEMRRQMREKDQQIQELRQQFSQISQRNPTQEEEDELARMAEDDILTVAQAKKLAQKMARNVAEDVIRQREASTVEERLQLRYPDYTDVLTDENIKKVDREFPEMAEAIGNIKDPYKKWVSAYKLVKQMLPKEAPPSLERKRAEANSQKPLSVNAVTKQSAIGNAHLFENGLTKELKTQLWSEMQQAMKGA